MTTAEIQTHNETVHLLFQEWAAQLKHAAWAMDCNQWQLADIMADGVRRFGAQSISAARDITLMSPQSIKLALDTVTAFPEDKRNGNLKFITHARIRSIQDPESQMEFFELAQAEGWNDLQVEHHINVKQLKANATKTDKSLFQLDHLFQFGRDFNKLDSTFSTLPPGQQAAVKDEIKKLVGKLSTWLANA